MLTPDEQDLVRLFKTYDLPRAHRLADADIALRKAAERVERAAKGCKATARRAHYRATAEVLRANGC